MKKIYKKYFIYLAILLLSLQSTYACQPNINEITTKQADKTAFKGYELYTWMDNDKQVFALLEGTNRNKTINEIVAEKIDYETLKIKFSMLAKKEFVTLVFAGMHQSLPPAKLTKQMEEELKKICADKEITLNLQS